MLKDRADSGGKIMKALLVAANEKLGAIAGLGGVTFQHDTDPTLGPAVTHLLVGNEQPPKRTSKFLFAMAKGVPIVKSDWVLHSVSHGKWLEHTPFLAVPSNANAGAQLAGKTFCVRSVDADGLDRATVEKLVMAAGGALSVKRSATHILTARRAAGEEAAQQQELVDQQWLFSEIIEGGGDEEAEEADEEDDEEEDDDDDAASHNSEEF